MKENIAVPPPKGKGKVKAQWGMGINQGVYQKQGTDGLPYVVKAAGSDLSTNSNKRPKGR